MTPNMMRQLWSLVESTHAQILLDLDDANLTNWLMKQIEDQGEAAPTQSQQDSHIMRNYIQDHLLLIRDIADQHHAHQPSMMAWATC